MFRSFELLNFIEKKGDYIESSLFALLYTLTKIDLDLLDVNKKIDFEKLEKNYKKAKSIIQKVIEKRQKELGEKYSNNNLFKSGDLNNYIDLQLSKN